MKNDAGLMNWRTRLVALALLAGLLVSCSPYAGIDVGVPFKVGPVYVSPSIGIGGFL
ncbi:MAG: hypothetical protein WAN46_07255 [Gammaproteobacteria bacterium]